jgi:L-ascorbate metabolism protein UlaG (beta-lactamase superfamily)
MNVERTSEAPSMLIRRLELPLHYKTFPVLAQNAEELKGFVKARSDNVEIVSLKPGESHELLGRESTFTT